MSTIAYDLKISTKRKTQSTLSLISEFPALSFLLSTLSFELLAFTFLLLTFSF
jgi:riboflavin transporter FmnP